MDTYNGSTTSFLVNTDTFYYGNNIAVGTELDFYRYN